MIMSSTQLLFCGSSSSSVAVAWQQERKEREKNRRRRRRQRRRIDNNWRTKLQNFTDTSIRRTGNEIQTCGQRWRQQWCTCTNIPSNTPNKTIRVVIRLSIRFIRFESNTKTDGWQTRILETPMSRIFLRLFHSLWIYEAKLWDAINCEWFSRPFR